jgi:hypothetical protein
MYFYSLYNAQFRLSLHGADGLSPTNLVAPTISGTGVVGQTLTSTDGTWTGTLPITFSYQWKRNGINILGATSSTYTLVSADTSTNITLQVTATNSVGSTSATSNTIAVISFPQSLINAFKTRVANDSGNYEAESCQLAQLTTLNNIA